TDACCASGEYRTDVGTCSCTCFSRLAIVTEHCSMLLFAACSDFGVCTTCSQSGCTGSCPSGSTTTTGKGNNLVQNQPGDFAWALASSVGFSSYSPGTLPASGSIPYDIGFFGQYAPVSHTHNTPAPTLLHTHTGTHHT